MITQFPPSVNAHVKYYVYIYSHPTSNEVFYVGKGKGNRVFHHLNDKSDSAKFKMIEDLRKEGLEPKIEILIHGIDEETALRVEAAVIDLIGRENLTNLQKGHKSAKYGRLNIRQIVSLYERTPVDIEDPVIAIRINRLYYPTIPAQELYDITRSQWKVNEERAKKAKYAFGVYEGIVQEVYEIHQWFEGGTTFNTRKEVIVKGRFEFIGRLAPDSIRNKYLLKSVDHHFKKGSQNPITYFNC